MLRMRRLDNRGEGTFGCVIMILLVAAVLFVGFTFGKEYYHYSAFENRLAEAMPYYRSRNKAFIQQSVIDAAKEYDIDLKEEQVKVQIIRKHNRIVIDVEYQRVVTMPFYSHTLTFRPHLTGEAF